jgi:hypothetical protein
MVLLGLSLGKGLGPHVDGRNAGDLGDDPID